jgi:hypothetical protein
MRLFERSRWVRDAFGTLLKYLPKQKKGSVEMNRETAVVAVQSNQNSTTAVSGKTASGVGEIPVHNMQPARMFPYQLFSRWGYSSRK